METSEPAVETAGCSKPALRAIPRPLTQDVQGYWLEDPQWIGYSSQMKRDTLTDTKKNLSAFVDQVQHGETILILDCGRQHGLDLT